MIKLGIVSVESTHVDAFCRIFNSDSSDPWNLEGAQIVALCNQDNAPERVAELQETYNIETVVTEPRDLEPMVDAAMVLGRDGSRHLEQAAPFLEAGKPCFVDKPMTHTVDDATELVNIAVDNGAALMSASGLRYCDELTAALDDLGDEEVIHASLIGPGELYFYGIHLTDVISAVMGPGVQCVSNLAEVGFDLLSVSFGDGRSASLQLLREAKGAHHGELITSQRSVDFVVEGKLFYLRTMERFLAMAEGGEPPIPYEDMIEAVAVLVAADISASQGGRAVRLGELRPAREQMVPSLT